MSRLQNQISVDKIDTTNKTVQKMKRNKANNKEKKSSENSQSNPDVSLAVKVAKRKISPIKNDAKKIKLTVCSDTVKKPVDSMPNKTAQLNTNHDEIAQVIQL